MNAEQKKRAAELLSAWQATAYALHGDAMADLLQEMADAPEVKPAAWVLGYYAGYLSVATVDGRVLPTGKMGWRMRRIRKPGRIADRAAWRFHAGVAGMIDTTKLRELARNKR